MPIPELNTFADALSYGLMVIGQQDRLMSLLQKRFGKLPKRLVNRIERANMDELDRWFDRLLDAASLKEVFADPLPA